jgi:hypothetical protein
VLVDFVLVVSSKYEEDLGSSLERSGQASQTFGLQRIHEDTVFLPIKLRLERFLRIIGWAIPADYHEEALCTFIVTRRFCSHFARILKLGLMGRYAFNDLQLDL